MCPSSTNGTPGDILADGTDAIGPLADVRGRNCAQVVIG
jgi:hypothetical protein